MATLSELITTLQQNQDDLLEMSMESLDVEERSYLALSGMYDCLKRIEDVLVETSLALFDFFDLQAENAERARELQSTQQLDAIEAKREQKKEKSKPSGSKLEQVAEKITPSKGLFDMALKVLAGGAAFLLFNNLEEVETFVKESLIPAVKSTYDFFKDTVYPFLKDNLGILVKGLFVTAGLIVTGGIISKLITAGSGIAKALSGLVKVFTIARTFLMTTFFPAIQGALTSIMSALTPVITAAAPFVLIAVAVGAALYGLYKLLDTIREKMNFDSIGDLLMYGVLKLKDSFARVGNLIIDVVNRFGGLIEAGAKLLGKDIDLPELQRMDTDSAERYRESKVVESESERDSGTNSLDSLPNYEDVEDLPAVTEPAVQPKPSPEVKKKLPEGVVKDWSGKYIGTHAEANVREMFDTPEEAARFVNASIEEAAKISPTVAKVFSERQELKAQMRDNLSRLKTRNEISPVETRSIQTQELNVATQANQDAKASASGGATNIVAPTNNNVTNTNVSQNVSLPMPRSTDASDRYAPLFGAR